MELISFEYDKDDGSLPTLHFVAVKNSDTHSVSGYDMLDGKQYKKFLRSRFVNNAKLHGVESEQAFLSGSLVTKDQLGTSLGYGKANVLFTDFSITPAQLATVATKKLNKSIVPVDNYFFIYNVKRKDIVVKTNKDNFLINITPGTLTFIDSATNTQISLTEFTSRILD